MYYEKTKLDSFELWKDFNSTFEDIPEFSSAQIFPRRL